MKPCHSSNLGAICHSCASGMLIDGKAKGDFFIMPDPGKKSFVMVDGDGAYLTVDKVFYAFDRKEDAREGLLRLRRLADIPGAHIRKADAQELVAYVVSHPELKLIAIKEWRKENRHDKRGVS